MKKRNPAAVLLLPVITIGIYAIYWLYATRKELNARSGNPNNVPRVILLFIPAFALAAFVGLTFLATLLIHRESAGAVTGIAAILGGIIAYLALIIIPLWWFWHYSRVLAQQSATDFTELYVLNVVLGWLLGLMPVWMLIAQLRLNKIADHDEATAAHHHTHTPHHEHPHHHPTQG